MPTPSFSRSRFLNEQQCCDARGCTAHRLSIGRFCRAHISRYRQYGHPDGGPLKPSSWAPIRAQVRELLAANEAHPGTQQVLQHLTGWMASATAKEHAFPGADEVARIARHGVAPLDLLVEVCALWSWLQQNPRALPQGGPDENRAADFAISRAVFGLAPRPRRVSRASGGTQSFSPKARSSALAHIGKELRQSLAPFLVNVAHHIESQAALQAKATEAMRAPFRIPL